MWRLTLVSALRVQGKAVYGRFVAEGSQMFLGIWRLWSKGARREGSQ
jgi:hypothetical protein